MYNIGIRTSLRERERETRFCQLGGFLQLKDIFLIPRKEIDKLLENVCKAAITGSHHIWISRNAQPELFISLMDIISMFLFLR